MPDSGSGFIRKFTVKSTRENIERARWKGSLDFGSVRLFWELMFEPKKESGRFFWLMERQEC